MFIDFCFWNVELSAGHSDPQKHTYNLQNTITVRKPGVMGSGASTPDPSQAPPDYLQPTAPPPEEFVTAEDIRRSKEGEQNIRNLK